MAQLTAPAQELPVSGPARYLNRELSLLDYLERVLAVAEDTTRPLLDRVQFLGISSFALDDFFQIRVAGLREQAMLAMPVRSPDGRTPIEQLREIRARVLEISERQGRLFAGEVLPSLAATGIEVVGLEALNKDEHARLHATFRELIFPVLTPLAVDPGHPFPYISNLSLNLAVMVRDPLRRWRRFARVKVPPVLPRLIAVEEGRRYVPLEEVIAGHLRLLFPGTEILEHHHFRVTRDADLDLDESEAEDLKNAIQTELRRQRRRARGVRLEVREGISDEIIGLLMRELELGPEDVYTSPHMLDLGGLGQLTKLDRSDLKSEPWLPLTPPAFAAPGADIFSVIRQGDVLVHHPYESFTASVEAFVHQAATDPQVLAIKQTLYRTSGPTSPITESLIHAAEAGKQVVALVELKARGDEQANVDRAGALEEAGVHVVYGLVGLKTHGKVALVVRKEEDGIRRYVHVGTGNYNPVTAATYEDIGLFSCDPELGADISELFNYLTGYSRQRRFRRVLVSPISVRSGLMDLIAGQSRPGGRITIKVNSLVDTAMADALYAASGAGAQVDLMVRGMCVLRPGLPGLSENIRVRSLVGRFLEHSRVFRFGHGDDAQTYIGSADLMDRNLDRRVEVLAPVLAAPLRLQIDRWLETALADDELAWSLEPNGTWARVPRRVGVNLHRILCRDEGGATKEVSRGA